MHDSCRMSKIVATHANKPSFPIAYSRSRHHRTAHEDLPEDTDKAPNTFCDRMGNGSAQYIWPPPSEQFHLFSV